MPNLLKVTYSNSVNKKRTRREILNELNFTKVIGLAGPDINDYISEIKIVGCKQFELYEKDRKMLSLQLSSLSLHTPISLIYDDIIKADANQEDTLYDLDFCVSINSLAEYVRKFDKNFIMTFSMRIGMLRTIRTFFELKRDKIAKMTSFDGTNNKLIITAQSGRKYIFSKYKDSSPMCCIATFDSVYIR